jgi:predicted dehydrogenase
VLDSHELDYLTWLLGPVRAILGFTAHTGALETDTEDVASACLRFESGALATIQVDYIQREARRRYHLTGTEGTIEWDLQFDRVDVFRAADKRTERLEIPLGDVNEMYVAQVRHVLEAIRQGLPPVTSLDHAMAVLGLQLALKQQPVG